MSGHGGGGGGTALREVFARFTVEADGSPLLGLAHGVEGLMGKLMALKGVIAGGVIVGALAHLTEGYIEQGHELMVTSEQLQVGAEKLKFWQSAAKLSGVESEELTNSLRFLQRNAFAAAEGSDEVASKFAKVGVHVKDANGQIKDGDVLLRELADGLAKTENPATRVAIAQGLLGRTGAKLLPLLTKGSEGIEEMRGELEALGISFSADGAKKAAEAHHAMLKFDLVVSSLKAKIATQLVPVFTTFYGWLTKAAGALNFLTKRSSMAQVVLVGLGIAAAAMAGSTLIALAPLIASTLAWVAGLSLAALAIDDVVTFLRGGDSLLGRWIDKTWGVGSAAAVLEKVAGWWDAVTAAVTKAWPTIEAIIPSLQTVGGALDKIGQAIAFVVDQFRNLDQAGEGTKKLFSDIAKGLGLVPKTADEQKFAHGADGFGSGPATDRGGMFSGEAGMLGSRLPGDAPRRQSDGDRLLADWQIEDKRKKAEAIAVSPLNDAAAGAATSALGLPSASVPASSGGTTNTTNVTIKVDANAKPDPNLVPLIKKAIQESTDHNNRNLQAGQ